MAAPVEMETQVSHAPFVWRFQPQAGKDFPFWSARFILQGTARWTVILNPIVVTKVLATANKTFDLILVQFVQSMELGSWIEAWVKALFEWCCANAGEVVTTLPCCHWYHTECIRATWQQTMTKHWHSYFAGVPIRGMCSNIFNPIQSCGNSETEAALGAPRNGCCMQGCAPCARRWWCLRNWESESSSVEEQVCRQTGHAWSCWPMLKQVNILKGTFDGGECLNSP